MRGRSHERVTVLTLGQPLHIDTIFLTRILQSETALNSHFARLRRGDRLEFDGRLFRLGHYSHNLAVRQAQFLCVIRVHDQCAEFIIDLPPIQRKVLAAQAEKTVDLLAPSGKSILVVDDERLLVEMLSQLLKMWDSLVLGRIPSS